MRVYYSRGAGFFQHNPLIRMKSDRKRFRERRWVVFAGVIMLGLSACASPETGPTLGGEGDRGRRVAPPSVDVTRNQAWRDAEALAALDPSRLTVIGSGESMKPVYGENTVLVLQKVPFASLSEGMNVAYRNESGRVVLHRLLAPEGRGWRVRGLNNENEDRERVTPENLLGIVYAAFANDQVK